MGENFTKLVCLANKQGKLNSAVQQLQVVFDMQQQQIDKQKSKLDKMEIQIVRKAAKQ